MLPGCSLLFGFCFNKVPYLSTQKKCYETEECGSSTITSWDRGDKCGSWRMRHLINEIRALIAEFNVVLFHVPRAQNSMADKLAKWSVGQEEGFLGDCIPD